MLSSLLKYRHVLPAVLMFITCGCAGMQEQLNSFQQKLNQMSQINLPDPIAVSLDQMPDDAAEVTVAIHDKITMADNDRSERVRFEKDIDAGSFLIGTDLTFSGSELYIYQTEKGNPSDKTMAGKIDFEGPLGRRASALFLSRFRSSENEIVIKEARVEPLYSTDPEPVMFIVAASSLPKNANLFPDSHRELFNLVGGKAISPSSIESSAGENEETMEYAIFVFLLDRVSPSADLQVKVSAGKNSLYGYKDASRYLDFNGWRVGIITGKFSLSNPNPKEPLYVKAVFTPGKEVGKTKTSRLIGRYALCKAEPMKSQ
jgi:hypothetical protein